MKYTAQTLIDHQYIYNSKKHPINAFKQTSIVQSFPGMNVCLDFFNDGTIYCNGNDIEEEVTQFNDYFITIRDKNPQFRDKIFYGIATGKEVVNQQFVTDDFVFYLFACFDKNTNRWFEYEELKSFIASNYYGLVKLCPMLGHCNNNYNDFKSFLSDAVYSILIFPYPQLFLTTNKVLFFLEYLNPIYQEELIDYSLNPRFVFEELTVIISEIICGNFFRTYLTKFCSLKNKSLDDLTIEDLPNFKEFILDWIAVQVRQDNNEKISIHYPLFIKMCKIEIRRKYVDFLIFGI